MNITKVLSGAALGTILSISSLTSAHAAVIQKDDTSAKVETKQQASITIAKAKQVALNKCKGTVQSAQMKKVNGTYVYVVKVLGEDGKQHTMNVNCDSGKVVKHDIQKKQSYISKSKAHSIALKNCKGAVQSSELKKENGVYVYVVKVMGEDGSLHTFHINGENGKVAKHEQKKQAHISKTKAHQIALNKYKGAVQSSDLKKENGVYIYVVKVLGEDGSTHTIHVNCDSGKIVKQKVQKKNAAITKTKAHNIALNKCKGTVKSSALKKENGKYVYVIKITAQNHTEQTVKVNAENGSICK
ncbi:PepSY domain-containing protein [Bacillus inaquosorum]|uniref:PepSY domain-containing protein n=1 Tax=Bacillus inaquosorum TaxID=483913 RepID=A0A9Q4EYW0_9BACI|nr:PepSY domain-containing protein [Bacillus inaquosorum]MCY7786454.1 PepSY domain-containing protein [Bacillus inaquosorum]MCY7820623.1 PepSY domain-containing protein [Bacillus inaquosorum]MCY7936512.1 PepSY domain-containing protein [Bacillus inaquosorum]MCY8083633.1 PepSY domain-containing protein [Bacillus inaquosorum]MCY8161573.1 PepSY domain-containing protein [Bacillus inaquosorum]